MSSPSTIARDRIASTPGNLSSQPADSVGLEAIGNRFPSWPNRETGTAEAAIEWS
jgi:hypothetical protein